MSRRILKYREHKNGQAFIKTVRLNDGNELYLGKIGSPESIDLYQQCLRQLRQLDQKLQGDSRFVAKDGPHTVLTMVAAYMSHAKTYYMTTDGLSQEYQELVYALQPLLDLFGGVMADDLEPRHLVAVQDWMIEQNISRRLINGRVGRIKRAIRWSSKTGVVRAALFHELLCVDGLRAGRTRARETEPVKPVDAEVVKATLPWMTSVSRAMVQVHYLCGMRSQDVANMRPMDIDRSGEVWLYRPAKFKTKHLGYKRVIAIPPIAQKLLLPFLDRAPDAYVFSPREALRCKHDAMRKESTRKTPVYPSELRARAKRAETKVRKTTRVVGTRYNRVSYRQAITNAIRKAKRKGVTIPHWHPHQLRHAIVTFISNQLGPREAQYYAGHKRMETTKIYDSMQVRDLVEIARQLDSIFPAGGL